VPFAYGIEKDRGDSFFESPALSFQSQDKLHSLFDLFLDPDITFTLVVGAGVSLDAGLPSWRQLIANLVNSPQFEVRWREAALSDGADLIRKAETVLQMIMATRASTPSEIIREALYMDRGGTDIPITPGRLADTIARLFMMLKQTGRSVGLVTTNFDTVLETAINGYGPTGETSDAEDSFVVTPHVLSETLDEAGKDPGWDPSSSVMHLHGLLAPGKKEAGKLVLTESDFLSVGPLVQRFLLNRMRDSVTIFIGVSLTDPNLVGPLWQLKGDYDEGGKTFVFSVCSPQNAAGADPVDLDTAEAYEIKKVDALAKVLPVTPILLKSYGQQMQLVNELAYLLQLDRDGRAWVYMEDDDPASSERYGHRLTRVLEKALTNINCSSPHDFPTGAEAKRLSDRLFAPLDDDGELTALLREAREELRNSHSQRDREIYRMFHQAFEDERFGIFLWLRSPLGGGAVQANYSLRLVGTSVYQHRYEWSLDRTAEVRSITRFPVAHAAFSGNWARQDEEKAVEWQLWRSQLAVPINCDIADLASEEDSTGKYLDDVPVGVISLNSTMYATRSEWHRDDQRSILSAMYTATFDRLTALLQRIAIRVIAASPPSPAPAPDPAGTA